MLGVPLKDIESGIEQNNGLYCIYVGQANSLEDRLKGNHVNGNGTGNKKIFSTRLKFVVIVDQISHQSESAIG